MKDENGYTADARGGKRIVLTPLEIDAVVERLFTFLDEEDLRQCRGVCRLWNQEADRALNTRHSRTIETQQDVFITLALVKINKCTITKLVIDNKDVEFVRDRLSLGSKSIMELLREVAPTLLSLSLQYVQCCQNVYTKIIRLFGKYDWLRHLELGTLKINQEDYVKLFPVKKEGSDEFVVFSRVRSLEYMDYSTYLRNRTNVACLMSTIGRMFPKLQQMNVFCLAREKPTNLDNIKFPGLEGLRVVMHSNDAPEQSYTGLTNVGVKCLMNMGLTKLNNFELFNIVPECTLLHDFLESVAATLQHLTLVQTLMTAIQVPGIAFRLSYESLPSPFPAQLPNLKSIHVTKSFIRNLNHLFLSAPNLEILYLDFEFGQNMGSILPASLEPPLTLKRLGFNWIDTVPFLKLMPFFVNNITHLELIDCYDSLVKIVFGNFHNLKELVLAQKTVGFGVKPLTDEPFTGMDLTTMKNLYRNWFAKDFLANKVPVMTKDKMDEIEHIRKGPCLANLLKLDALIIRLIEPSQIKLWMFWPFWELKALSAVIVSGIKITKGILQFMHVSGGGFICSGPFDDLIKNMIGSGLRIKFINEGNVKTYTFIRRVDSNGANNGEKQDIDDNEKRESSVTTNQEDMFTINNLYDTLSDFGSSVSIDFSKTIIPAGLPPLLHKK